jgi:uncharacterized protein involved in exopolysaccharide biosynthesis
MLAAALEKQKQEAYRLNEDAVQYAIMQRDVQSSRDLYQGLLKNLKEAGISKEVGASMARKLVVDNPRAVVENREITP